MIRSTESRLWLGGGRGAPPLSPDFINIEWTNKMNQERDLPLEVFKPHVQMYAIVEPGSGDYELLGHGFLSIVTDEVDNETVDYL